MEYSNLRLNALNQWVPSTIRTISGSGDLLMSALASNETDHAWVVRCLILKQERLLKSDPLSSQQVRTYATLIAFVVLLWRRRAIVSYLMLGSNRERDRE